MPTINLNRAPGGRGGKPGTMPPSATGPRSGVPWMRPEIAQAWAAHQDAAKKFGTGAASADYTRAQRQQAAQQRAQQAADQHRRREEDKAWRQRAQAEAAERRERERQSRAEMRQHEQQRRYDETASKRLYNIGQRARPDAPLSPSAFRSMQRQIDIYRREYPDRHGSTSAILMSMGSQGGAYSRASIGRLGSAGMRAAESGDARELKRIEKLLEQIARSSATTAKDASASPGARADAARMASAVADARNRIGAGRLLGGSLTGRRAFLASRGHSRIKGLIERTALGLIAGPALEGLLAAVPEGLMAGVEGGAIGMGIGAAGAAIPAITAAGSNFLLSGSQRWINYRRNMAELGRRGGLNSNRLVQSLYGGAQGVPFLNTLGLSSEQAADILSKYGPAMTSYREPRGILTAVRGAEYANGMGLSQNQLLSYGNVAAQLGLVRPGIGAGFDLQTQYNKLQGVMAVATAQGLDHSAITGQMVGLLRQQAASGGLAVDPDGLARFLTRMIGSGLPQMRMGGAANAAAGWNQAAQTFGPGGDAGRNLVMSAYMSAHGGAPRNADQMKNLIGSKLYNTIASEPGGAKILQGYFSAMKRGNPYALSFLGDLVKSNPEFGFKVANSMFGKYPEWAQLQMGSQFMGISVDAYAALQATGKGTPVGRGLSILQANNPLGLAYAGQPGAVPFGTLADGEQIAGFNSNESGVAAAYLQILKDKKKAGGQINLRRLIGMWAPNGKHNDTYAAYVAKQAGINPGAAIDTNNTALMAKIMRGMGDFETGHAAIASGTYRNGIKLARGETVPGTGNVPYGMNTLQRQAENQSLLASQGNYTNLASTVSQDVLPAMSYFSDAVVSGTTKIEKGLESLAHTLESWGARIAHGAPATPGQTAPIK